LKLYPVGSDEKAAAAHYNSTRDQGMGWADADLGANQGKPGKAPAYLYHFTRIPPGPPRHKYRAYTRPRSIRVREPAAKGGLGRCRPQASGRHVELLGDFAATGNPNGKGLEKWRLMKRRAIPAMIFGDHVVVRHEVNKAALDFFDRFFARSSNLLRTGWSSISEPNNPSLFGV